MLIPVFKDSFGTSENITISSAVDQQLLLVLVRAFDKSTAKTLNNKEGVLWQIFVRVLRACIAKGVNTAWSRSSAH